jgi:glutamate--cysteine ligase
MQANSHILTSLVDTLCREKGRIEDWFRQKWMQTPPSFYGSVDLRDAGFKIAPVDTNLFPAGFNHLPIGYEPVYVEAVKRTLHALSPECSDILLIPENHTRNMFYLENVFALQQILIKAGFNTRAGSLRGDITTPEKYSLPSGQILTVQAVQRQRHMLNTQNFLPNLIILNNDLSVGVPEILKGISQKILPSVKLGWFNRLKSDHCKYLKRVVEAFAQYFAIDSWLLQPYFEYCQDISFHEGKNLHCLVSRAEDLLLMIQKKYKDYQIKEEPFLVIKADTGTYGMAVLIIKHPNDFRVLNRKQKNKMTYIKGGQPVSRAIIQEGVHSVTKIKNNTLIAEPVMYLIGTDVVGGFYRGQNMHTSMANFNTKGMVFDPYSTEEMDALLGNVSQNPRLKRFYAYHVIARLAFLAASYELNNLTE